MMVSAEYINFLALSNNRKANPDYSHCIPTALRVTYIDPKGKFRYAEVSVYGELNLHTVRRLFAKVKEVCNCPLDEHILEEEPLTEELNKIATSESAIDISKQLKGTKQRTLNDRYKHE